MKNFFLKIGNETVEEEDDGMTYEVMIAPHGSFAVGKMDSGDEDSASFTVTSDHFRAENNKEHYYFYDEFAISFTDVVTTTKEFR